MAYSLVNVITERFSSFDVRMLHFVRHYEEITIGHSLTFTFFSRVHKQSKVKSNGSVYTVEVSHFRFIEFVKLDEFIWNLEVHILYKCG